MTRLLSIAVGVFMATACSGPGLEPGYTRSWSALVFWEPGMQHGSASIVGDFNSWTPGRLNLSDDDGDGVFTAQIVASPGFHQYRIQLGEETFLDQFNPLTLYDENGRENSAVFLPDCSVPALQLVDLQTEPTGQVEISARFLQANSGMTLDTGSIAITTEDGTEFIVDAEPIPGDIHATAQMVPGKHRMHITAKDKAGIEAEQISVPLWIEHKPFDWHDAVIYQVMIDRFKSGQGQMKHDADITDYQGGDLYGVNAAIKDGYFDKLGVNVLWLSPLYENPDGEFIGRDGYPSQAYHGYWPSEPRQVESNFGGEQALEQLVQTAHAHGMRVLADVVPNHVHIQHPYWREHQSGGWFNDPDGDCICGTSCSWATSMEQCWFTSFLPDLSFQEPQEVEQVVSDMIFWLDRFDFDGLRIDAVPMMPRLVVRQLKAAIDRGLGAGPVEIYLLGETYTNRGGQPYIRYYLGPYALSGQFDFPVMWALRDSLSGRISMRELDKEVRASAEAWQGSGAIMAPILGNHDVPRFVSDVNGDELWQSRINPAPVPNTAKPYELLKIAWTFLLSQAGAPVIYYGDEIGLAGACDPDNRRRMRFGAELSSYQKDVLEHVTRMGKARACAKALRRGITETLVVNDNLYVYLRDAQDGFPVIVALSRATVPRELDIELPVDASLDDSAVFADLFSAKCTRSGRTIHLSLPPRSSALLLSNPDCLEMK